MIIRSGNEAKRQREKVFGRAIAKKRKRGMEIKTVIMMVTIITELAFVQIKILVTQLVVREPTNE